MAWCVNMWVLTCMRLFHETVKKRNKNLLRSINCLTTKSSAILLLNFCGRVTFTLFGKKDERNERSDRSYHIIIIKINLSPSTLLFLSISLIFVLLSLHFGYTSEIAHPKQRKQNATNTYSMKRLYSYMCAISTLDHLINTNLILSIYIFNS